MLPLDPISTVRAAMPAPDLAGPMSALRDAASLERLTPQTAGADALKPVAHPESFSGILDRLVTEVNARQHTAATAVRDLQSGGEVPLHQAVIAMEEAQLSFQLMVEVRNKVLEGYQEVMRMQV